MPESTISNVFDIPSRFLRSANLERHFDDPTQYQWVQALAV